MIAEAMTLGEDLINKIKYSKLPITVADRARTRQNLLLLDTYGIKYNREGGIVTTSAQATNNAIS